jgi:hypothetical protein
MRLEETSFLSIGDRMDDMVMRMLDASVSEGTGETGRQWRWGPKRLSPRPTYSRKP